MARPSDDPYRLVYVADTRPTTLLWESVFPGAEIPPVVDVVAWAHPLTDVRLRIDKVFAHDRWGWTIEMVWRITAGGDSCSLGLFGDTADQAGEDFMAELLRAVGPRE